MQAINYRDTLKQMRERRYGMTGKYYLAYLVMEELLWRREQVEKGIREKGNHYD